MGTTGLPELIARTHDDYAYNARASAEVAGVTKDSIYLVSLPAGGRVVMLPSPEPVRAFATIEAEGVTHTAVVPAVAGRWLERAAQHSAGQLTTLRVVQVGGARLVDELVCQVEPVLGARLQQVFGMAEGLLLTRGPYTPRGYYRAAEHNARSFTGDGWFRTGDVCLRTPEGNLVVAGRDKDMINRGGEKISAEEIASLVYRLPSVSQVAAVAMPDPVLGERVCVYVVPRAGATVTLEEIRARMESAEVARFKLPERLVVVEELAWTKVGKIDKKALRADIADRLKAELPGG
ncbi:AMP-binding protein [Nonomuraea sp. NPDC048881]|uniref:AMP-binding protein n=1 Tax=Nonomuraea sp. NPDC048881 TaxID=3155030 RepID=UPI00340D8AA0